ncbi:xanthine dehydrogenase family protein molybdopterin-binding subunit [Amycolatopsis sp. FDAARGOS 1241]|uniref:xanthine dehydrogenase family protein molybdopterin-binding subunit n=1 Tax=Amycolatopsis sp. FDAARGOS 1241 TaxID=2778070 RepID=UPI0019506F36|nr:xanthine dehydrogenase family protein molybdopterin-binding subunit [Amycolatopsis sp. FDAARGOS 1241]QRP50370.1 xanthine dehydrogenase family protein molybdopterin-binding subunit [Amycolatopsis sp. FDAARGOS 1241]
MTDHRWVSKPGRIREDRRFVRGAGRYVADITPPGTLHIGLVTSPHPHARITGIDASEALALEGVVTVLTGAELAKETDPLRQYLDLEGVDWRPLAVEQTRYAGEWIAAVVATSRAVAEDGADLVVVDYDQLPAVMDPERAIEPGSPLVHPDQGTNVMAHREFTWGAVAEAFEHADHTVRTRVRWNRNSTVPLETFGVVASWDADRDLLDVWASIQMPQFPDQLASALRIPGNQVRVHFDVDVGGSYGVKRGIKHAVLAGHLSRLLHRPVKFIEDRAENMHGGDFHGPDRSFDVELAFTGAGEFTGIRIAVIDDEGAYPGRSPLQLAKPIGAIVGPYRIPVAAYTATAVTTNKTGQVAVRGFGQAPTNYAIESAVDAAARVLGMDRFELRRRNFIRPEQFPYRIPSGTEYDSGDYPAVLDKAIALADLPGLVRRRDAIRAEGKLAGIGLATCLEPGGGNAIFENIMHPGNDKTTFPEACRLRVDGAGAVTAVVSLSSAGQSHDTMVATLVGEELGRDPATIAVIRADSLTGMPSQSPVGSRMTIVLGAAIRGAADELKAALRRIAAHNLDVAETELDYDGGDFTVRADPSRRLGWHELVAIAHRKQHLMPQGMQPGLEVVHVAHTPRSGTLTSPDGRVQLYPCYSFETHVVLAVLDPGTGHVDLDAYYLAHDCGTVINPDVVRGMVYGGTAHGIGVALYEQFAFSEEGQPLTQSFMDYLLPSTHEVPHIVDTEHCTPSPYTTLGQKGAGEAGYMGAPAAVASAVNDALAPTGAPPITSLPIKPSDVWHALHDSLETP